MLYILLGNLYNTGDRVFFKKENLIIKKISFLSTKLEKWSGEYVIINNQVISNNPINNIMRSLPQFWKLELVINNTDLGTLEGELKAFVKAEVDFLEVFVSIEEIICCKFIKVLVIVRHKMNYQNGFFTCKNHNTFMRKLIGILNDLNLFYMPLNYNIEIM